MEQLSSAFHASQQSTARNANPEGLLPNVRPLNPAEMRQKVVEILSGTANGCLHELGYYPGMPIKLQELEARNKKWQKENLKLYEDNKRLMHTLKNQAEALKMLEAPDGEKINYITNLEVENHALKVQLEQLKARPSSEAFQTVVNDQDYAALNRNYAALTETYNLAYQEIVRLREIVRTGQNTFQPQQNQNSLHSYPQQNPNAPITRRTLPPQIPQIQTQIGIGEFVQGQHHFVSSPVAISPVNQHAFAQNQHQQQVRRNENRAGQIDHSLRTQYPISSNQIQRRTTANSMAIPVNPSLPVHQHMVAQNQLVNTPYVPPIAQASSSRQEYFQTHPGPSTGNVQNVQNLRRASAPVMQMNLHPIGQNAYGQTFHPPSQPHNVQTTVRTGSVPLPNQTLQVNIPLAPASAPPNVVSSNTASSFFAPPMSNFQVPVAPPDLPQESQNRLPTTVAPNDTYISHPEKSPLPAPIPIMLANVHVDIPYTASFPSTSSSPQFNVEQVIQRHDTATSSSPMHPGHDTLRTLTPSSNSASPYLCISHLKREATSAEHDTQIGEPSKKPRLDSPDMEMSTSLSPSTGPFSNPTLNVIDIPAVPSIQSTVCSSEQTGSSEQTVDEGEEEEEIVEIGPDGLRIVEDILEQVYGENRRGEVICWFCKNRFEKGFTEAPPKAFIGATDQELEAHCVENHEVAWNQARASI